MLDAGAGVGSLTAAFVGEICSREHVSVVTSLPPDDGVPIKDLADRLSIFSGPNWSIFLMASPTLWKEADPDIPIYQQAKAEYAELQKFKR